MQRTTSSRSALWLATASLTAALTAFQVGAQPSALPPAGNFGPVTVISGGTGEEQAELFKQSASRYPLRVVFSLPGGAYTVPDEFMLIQGGNVLAQLPSAGPWLLIDLPPGRYTMQALVEGKLVERPVTVGKSGTTVDWVVPSSDPSAR